MFKLSSLLNFLLGPRLYISTGGGNNTPANTTQTTTQELPEWARGYAKDTLAKASALTDVNQNPYQTYDANRIAGFSPLQQQAMTQAGNMAPAKQLGEATGLAGAAGQRAMNTQYTPGQFGMMQAQAPNLQQYQMGPAQQVGTQDYTGQNVSQYMNPYMQNVVDIQQREAQRQADIAGTQRAGQAVRSGAFGGSRAGLMEAEAARNLATQKGDIQATGQSAAFQNAQQQFNTQQGRDLQAQLANQGMGFNVGQQNLNAMLGVQQLGAGQNLQAQLANQQAFQQAQQAREQSRQYGAGYGMQGLQTGLQAAGQLGQLGQQQFGQGMDINKLQSAYGGQQQQLEQQGLSQSYQDFLNQQNYPYKQLGFMSDILRGTPTGSSSSMNMYQAPPSMLGQLGGLGLGAYGVSQLMKAEGGSVHDYADGGEVNTYAGDQGSVTSEENIADIADSLSDQQLQVAYQNAQARRDVNAIKAIETELAQRASDRSGMSSAFNQLPPNAQENMYEVARGANGGIVAFADGGEMATTTSAGELELDALRVQGIKDARKQAEKATRMRFLEISAPEVANRLKAEDAASTPKPFYDFASFDRATADYMAQREAAKGVKNKPIKSSMPQLPAAVKQAAAEKGFSEDDLIDSYGKMRTLLSKESEADIKGLQALIDKQSGKSKEVKDKMLGQALAEYGFAMAAAASRPGQSGNQGISGLLTSAAAAAPTLAASVKESNKLMREADENDAKLNMEMFKYKVALKKGDSAAAMQHASNVKSLQMQDKQLALKREEMGQTAAYQQGSLGLQRAGLEQKDRQLQQIAGVRGLQSLAQLKGAEARLAQVGVNAGKVFDETRAQRRMQELTKQYAPTIANQMLRQERQQFVKEALQVSNDAQADAAQSSNSGAKDIFSLLD